MKELEYLSTADLLLLKTPAGQWNATGKAIVAREKTYKYAVIGMGSLVGVLALVIGGAVVMEIVRRNAKRRESAARVADVLRDEEVRRTLLPRSARTFAGY